MKPNWVLICCVLTLAGAGDSAGASPIEVPLIPQESSVWCWAASAEMVLRALGSTDDPSQRRQVERLYDLDGKCVRTLCADGYTTSECQRTGLPQYHEYGFDAEVTAPFEGLEWSRLAEELRCGPVAFAWEFVGPEGKPRGDGHMVVLTSARDVSLGLAGSDSYRLGPLIAVNNPSGGSARAAGACSASFETWSFGYYRRMTPKVHYFGFRPAGEPYEPCTARRGERSGSDGSADAGAKVLEGATPHDLVAKLLHAVEAVGTARRHGPPDDFAWLLKSAGLRGSKHWACEATRDSQDAEIRRFRCSTETDQRFYLDVLRASSGAWQLAAIETPVTGPTD